MKRLACHMWVLVLLMASAQAAEPAKQVRWEREAAMAASVDSDSAGYRSELRSSLRSGDGESMLATLRHVQSSPELSAPARERLVFGFVEDLRQEPPGSVPAEVIEFLKSYPVTVMVEHHDHPYADEALYNIPTATFGVVNHWTRQQAAFDGASMLSKSASSLVRAYQDSSDPARQRGFIDAIATAEPATLLELNRVVLDQIEQAPQLTALAGHSALRTGDLESLQSLAQFGSGPGLNEVLRLSAVTLDTGQRERLLNAALNSGKPENAALAIAHLGSTMGHSEHMLQSLVGQLSDPQLGAAAALALSRNPSPSLQRVLSEIGRDDKTTVAASRARLALQLMQDFDEPEAPR